MFKNWKTSLVGCGTGIPAIIEGITTHNWMLVLTGIGTLLLGLSAKDSNVTGGTVKQ